MDKIKQLLILVFISFGLLLKGQTTSVSESSSSVETFSTIDTIDVNIWLFLEGPFNLSIGRMNAGLYQKELLPGMLFTGIADIGEETPAGQPYSISPWLYNGQEGQGYTNASYDSIAQLNLNYDVVDWVLVSFRMTPEPSSEVGRCAALLLEDGRVYFPEINTITTAADSLYVLVEHRNHMSVMSPYAIPITNGNLLYDFRTEDSYKIGSGAGQKLITGNYWYMMAGDFNQLADISSYEINGNDRVVWSVENGLFRSYRLSDCNMDGEVNGNDRFLWKLNNGFSSSVLR